VDRRSSDVERFTRFVEDVEPRLRHAFVAVFGQERGREATAEALAYGWEHWARIETMDNPAGYLYRVGRSRSKPRRARPMFAAVPVDEAPHVEPHLPEALGALSEKQRLAVVMIHAYGWSRESTAELLDVTVSTIDTHLLRGLTKLRYELGVETHA